VTLQDIGDNVYRLDISGVLRVAEFDAVRQLAATEILRHRKVRLLVVLSHFSGWSRDSAWHDLSFYIQYGDDIERIAIVGDERWESEALMFAGADLRKAAVKFFRPHDAASARSWLTGVSAVPESA
jgi:hypothetical protein